MTVFLAMRQWGDLSLETVLYLLSETVLYLLSETQDFKKFIDIDYYFIDFSLARN